MQTVAKKRKVENISHGLLSMNSDMARYLSSFLFPVDDSALNAIRRPAFALLFKCMICKRRDVDVLTILERTSTPQIWRLEYFVDNTKIPSQVLFFFQRKGMSLKDFLADTESFLSELFGKRFYKGPNDERFRRPSCECYLTEARNKTNYEDFLKQYCDKVNTWSVGTRGSFPKRNRFCLEFDPNVPLNIHREDNFCVYLMQRVFLFLCCYTHTKKAHAAEMFEKLENGECCLQQPTVEKTVIADEIEGLWSKAHCVPYY